MVIIILIDKIMYSFQLFNNNNNTNNNSNIIGKIIQTYQILNLVIIITIEIFIEIIINKFFDNMIIIFIFYFNLNVLYFFRIGKNLFCIYGRYNNLFYYKIIILLILIKIAYFLKYL